MRTFPILDKDGKLQAFEIENLFIDRHRTTKIVERIPNVLITKRPRKFMSWWREDIFCKFELNGFHFQIEEPFGDNSRYWIGSTDSNYCSEMEIIEQAFKCA